MFDPYDPTDEFETDGGDRSISEITVGVDDVIQTNMRFFKEEGFEYEDPHAYTHLETRRKIKLDQGDRHDLSEILTSLLLDEPVAEQSALLMHALVGVHFFPDANHRTSMATVRKLLDDNGISGFDVSLHDFDERTEAARNASKEERKKNDVDMDNYYEKDSLYEVWRKYFEDVL